MTVMLVDDEPDLLVLTKRFLKTEGYEVHAFGSADLAIWHFRQDCTTCTIIVSDIRLPGMSGFELVRRIKEVLPKTRVVLVSFFVIHKEEFRKVIPSLDVDEFVMMPFSKDELVNAIKHASA